MINGTHIKHSEYNDKCPVHGGEIRAEYNFGKYAEATIYTHHKCSCCVVRPNDGYTIDPDFEYFTSYQRAAGRAE